MSEQETLFRKPKYCGNEEKVFQDLWDGYVNTANAALTLARKLQTYESATLTEKQMDSMRDAEHCFKRAIVLSEDVDIFLNPGPAKKPIDLRTRVLSNKYDSVKASNNAML